MHGLLVVSVCIGISCLVSLLHYSILFLLYCNTFLLTSQTSTMRWTCLMICWYVGLPRTCVFFVEWLIRHDHYFRRDDATCQLCQFPIHALHQDSLILIYALHPLISSVTVISAYAAFTITPFSSLFDTGKSKLSSVTSLPHISFIQLLFDC